MKSITGGIAAAVLALGVAHAQTTTPATPTTPAPSTPPSTMATPAAPAPMPGATTRPGMTSTAPGTTAPGTMPGSGVVNRNTGPAAASGDTNQAVATTTANAATPARGRNSFSMGEARRRIESRGFSNVSGLAKDNGGVWRGKGMKDGTQVSVWLDYKGNVGQQ